MTFPTLTLTPLEYTILALSAASIAAALLCGWCAEAKHKREWSRAHQQAYQAWSEEKLRCIARDAQIKELQRQRDEARAERDAALRRLEPFARAHRDRRGRFVKAGERT